MHSPKPLSPGQAATKRTFDVVLASLVLLLTGWAIPVLAWISRLSTGEPGIFRQERVGLHGERFNVLKIRTMRTIEGNSTTNTRSGDARITAVGRTLRRFKLDELPQFWNVFRGDMSLVGPRPDVPGYYDELSLPNSVLLTLRPGITSPAALKFRNEEELLQRASDPDRFNNTVLFPAKVEENLEYLTDWSLGRDLTCLLRTAASMVGPILLGRAK